MKLVIALISGILFGAGLVISGMTDPAKVLAFLDLFGNWDFALIFVMGGAVITTLVSYQLVFRRGKPLFASRFHLPSKTRLDKKLLIGSAIFGIGWGLYGYCPGPALAALAYLQQETLLFVLAMMAGVYLDYLLSKPSNKRC